MAKKITELPTLPTADNDDLIPIVDISGSVTKKVTASGLGTAAISGLPDKFIPIEKVNSYSTTGVMNAAGVTTSDQVVASVTLPTVTAPHKYLITAIFAPNHNNGTAIRDYTASIKSGSTLLRTATVSMSIGTYTATMIPITTIHTSSASGGETINFTIRRANDNGGLHQTTSSGYTIVDLGLA